jgi:hypothetical protein
LEHSNIFETLWSLGVENLTQEEFADCFEKYCLCGIKAQDPNALLKYRVRFQMILKDSTTPMSREGP